MRLVGRSCIELIAAQRSLVLLICDRTLLALSAYVALTCIEDNSITRELKENYNLIKQDAARQQVGLAKPFGGSIYNVMYFRSPLFLLLHFGLRVSCDALLSLPARRGTCALAGKADQFRAPSSRNSLG